MYSCVLVSFHSVTCWLFIVVIWLFCFFYLYSFLSLSLFVRLSRCSFFFLLRRPPPISSLFLSLFFSVFFGFWFVSYCYVFDFFSVDLYFDSIILVLHYSSLWYLLTVFLCTWSRYSYLFSLMMWQLQSSLCYIYTSFFFTCRLPLRLLPYPISPLLHCSLP